MTDADTSAPRRLWVLFPCAFLVLFSYAVYRPPVESLFLEVVGSQGLPVAWLGVALGALVSSATVSRLLTKIQFLPLVALVVGVFVCLSLFFQAVYGHAPTATAYAIYILKDVYIVVLVEMFWVFANNSFSTHHAKRLYGWFLAAGSVGGVCGNLLSSQIASRVATETSLLIHPATLTTLLLFGFANRKALLELSHQVSVAEPNETAPSLAKLFSDSYLVNILLLVVVVQITINFVDFQANAALESAFSDTQVRTKFIGYLYLAIDAASLLLLATAGLLLGRLGVGKILVGVPIVLAAPILMAGVAASWLLPVAAKGLAKSFDYSILRATKELLYIPLSAESRSQGKAWIDVFVYRGTKAAVSLLLLSAPSLLLARTGAILCTVLWLAVAWRLAHTYKQRSSLADVER